MSASSGVRAKDVKDRDSSRSRTRVADGKGSEGE